MKQLTSNLRRLSWHISLQKAASVLLCSLIVAAYVNVGRVAAESTAFGQKILPMNCVFETVNDGTGTVRYLTPAECGVIIEPPAPPMSGGVSGQPPMQQSGHAQSGVPPSDGGRPIFFLPNSPDNSSVPDTSQRLPWQPITTVSSQNAQSSLPAGSKPSGKVVAVVGVGLLALIVLVVLVF